MIAPAAWTTVASTCACATSTGSTPWLWIPLAAFALLNAGSAFLRILNRSEA